MGTTTKARIETKEKFLIQSEKENYTKLKQRKFSILLPFNPTSLNVVPLSLPCSNYPIHIEAIEKIN